MNDASVLVQPFSAPNHDAGCPTTRKPEIPEASRDGIPIRDDIELEMAP